jgi:hypothetical protein
MKPWKFILLFAGVVTLAGCGSSTPEPPKMTPELEAAAAQELEDVQNAEMEQQRQASQK